MNGIPGGVPPLVYILPWAHTAAGARWLLEHGADANRVWSQTGEAPLHAAAQRWDVAMVEKLVAARAKPDAAETSGLTALMMAAHTGSLAVVRALLAHGANVNAATTETGDTALMWAIADRHTEIADALLDAHADVHVSSTKGFTPLMFAARNGDVVLAKKLVAHGALHSAHGRLGPQHSRKTNQHEDTAFSRLRHANALLFLETAENQANKLSRKSTSPSILGHNIS